MIRKVYLKKAGHWSANSGYKAIIQTQQGFQPFTAIYIQSLTNQGTGQLMWDEF